MAPRWPQDGPRWPQDGPRPEEMSETGYDRSLIKEDEGSIAKMTNILQKVRVLFRFLRICGPKKELDAQSASAGTDPPEENF